jgi:hypothetical protein
MWNEPLECIVSNARETLWRLGHDALDGGVPIQPDPGLTPQRESSIGRDATPQTRDLDQKREAATTPSVFGDHDPLKADHERQRVRCQSNRLSCHSGTKRDLGWSKNRTRTKIELLIVLITTPFPNSVCRTIIPGQMFCRWRREI